MEIFKWVEDIEKIYDNLIEKAKQKNIEEIKNLRKEQEKSLENLVFKKQELVNLTLKSISEEINNEINKVNNILNDIIQKIEINFQKNKNTVKKSILQKLGFDF